MIHHLWLAAYLIFCAEMCNFFDYLCAGAPDDEEEEEEEEEEEDNGEDEKQTQSVGSKEEEALRTPRAPRRARSNLLPLSPPPSLLALPPPADGFWPHPPLVTKQQEWLNLESWTSAHDKEDVSK